jgi:LuxR family maltose regulon positive regulatory protein
LEIRGIGFYFPEILCRLALTNILCEKKDFQRAAHELALADDVVRRSKSRIMDFMYRLTKARTALAQGDEAGGMAMLRSALELGRSQNFINMLYWWQPTVMAVLCQRALEDGIEVDYVQNLVRKRNLFSESPPLDLDNWPWPLKISTLGRFTMTKDGQPLIFSGKVQQKPLFMLKAVIAFGGREVSEDQLMDALWPDAEGDVGRISFRTTLHRLRQLTGNEKAIQLQEGRITLDLRYCWVDAWAFERIAGRAEAFWKKARDNGNRADDQMARDIVRLSEKAMTLYEGEFLPGDRRQPWTFPMRERLKSRFISLAGKIGDYYTNSEQWERGLECYLNALEVDELQEEFYRRLMISYHKLEKCAEALSVYDRCRGILSSVLGIEPSPETEALRRKIRSTRQLCG